MEFFVLMLLAIIVPVLISSFAMSWIKRRLNSSYKSNKEIGTSSSQKTMSTSGASIMRTHDCITIQFNKGFKKYTYRVYRDAENEFKFKISYYPELSDAENAKIKDALLRILQKDCPEIKIIM